MKELIERIDTQILPRLRAWKSRPECIGLFSEIDIVINEVQSCKTALESNPKEGEIERVARAINQTALNYKADIHWIDRILAKAAISAMNAGKPSIWKQFPQEKPQLDKGPIIYVSMVKGQKKPKVRIIRDMATLKTVAHTITQFCYESDLITSINSEISGED